MEILVPAVERFKKKKNHTVHDTVQLTKNSEITAELVDPGSGTGSFFRILLPVC